MIFSNFWKTKWSPPAIFWRYFIVRPITSMPFKLSSPDLTCGNMTWCHLDVISKNRFDEDLFIDSSASRHVPMPGDSFAVAGNRLFLIMMYCMCIYKSELYSELNWLKSHKPLYDGKTIPQFSNYISVTFGSDEKLHQVASFSAKAHRV